MKWLIAIALIVYTIYGAAHRRRKREPNGDPDISDALNPRWVMPPNMIDPHVVPVRWSGNGYS